MKQLRKKYSKFMRNRNSILGFLCFFMVFISVQAQENDSIPDTQIEPPETPMVADAELKKDTINTFKKIKIDGISAVVGDYLISGSIIIYDDDYIQWNLNVSIIPT